MINKVITALLVVLMGFINALISGGSFSNAGQFPLDMIVFFTVGQGLSAILMNVLEYIVLASVHIKDEKKEYVVRAWIFFSVAILILVVCLFFLFYSYRNEYCKYYLNKADNTTSNSNKKESVMISVISHNENSEQEKGSKEQTKIIKKEEIEENLNLHFYMYLKKYGIMTF